MNSPLHLYQNVLTQFASEPFATVIKGIIEIWGKKTSDKKHKTKTLDMHVSKL